MDSKVIAEILIQTSELIDQEQFDAVYRMLTDITERSPEIIDDRLKAEIQLLLRSMEYRTELKDYSNLRDLCRTFRYCEKEYGSIGRAVQSDLVKECEMPEKDTIWWCWLQGLENAPEIVRHCYDSLKKLDRKIVVLTEDNIHDYVKLPYFVEEKYHKGLIGRTHYSDLVRLELLTERGGTWIDATVWVSGTDQILPVLNEEDLFMYRSGNVSDYIIFDNWFIHAKKKSLILEATKKMMYAYWERENEIRNYFLNHLMMTLACQYYNAEYQKIPLFSNEPAHVLQHDLFKEYSDKRWRQILAMSNIHKLTYKYEDNGKDNTFLQYLLKR